MSNHSFISKQLSILAFIHPLTYLSMYLFIFLYIHPCIHLLMYLYPYIYTSMLLFIHSYISIHLPIPLPTLPLICLWDPLPSISTYPFIQPSIHLYPFICPPTPASIHGRYFWSTPLLSLYSGPWRSDHRSPPHLQLLLLFYSHSTLKPYPCTCGP